MNKIFKVFSRALAAATEIPRDTFVAVAQVQIDVPTRFIVVREHFHLHRRVVSSPRDKFRPSLHHSSEDSGRETECGSRGGDSEFLPWGLVAKESARDQGPLWSSRTSRTSEEARLHCCAGLLRCCVRLSFLVDPTPGGCAGGTSAARHGAATSVAQRVGDVAKIMFLSANKVMENPKKEHDCQQRSLPFCITKRVTISRVPRTRTLPAFLIGVW